MSTHQHSLTCFDSRGGKSFCLVTGKSFSEKRATSYALSVSSSMVVEFLRQRGHRAEATGAEMIRTNAPLVEVHQADPNAFRVGTVSWSSSVGKQRSGERIFLRHRTEAGKEEHGEFGSADDAAAWAKDKHGYFTIYRAEAPTPVGRAITASIIETWANPLRPESEKGSRPAQRLAGSLFRTSPRRGRGVPLASARSTDKEIRVGARVRYKGDVANHPGEGRVLEVRGDEVRVELKAQRSKFGKEYSLPRRDFWIGKNEFGSGPGARIEIIGKGR